MSELPIDPVADGNDYYMDLHRPRAAQVFLLILGSLFFLLIHAVTMSLVMGSGKSNPIVSGMMGPLIAFSVFGLILAIHQLRQPRRVWLTPDHLGVENWFGYFEIAWGAIAFAERKSGQLTTSAKKGHSELVLRDRSGKSLSELTAANEMLDGLQGEIALRAPMSHAEPSSAPNFDKSVARKKWTLILMGAFLTMMGIASTAMFTRDFLRARVFHAKAVNGEGVIKKHYLFNVTHRMEVEVTGAGGEVALVNVAMQPEMWELLEGATVAPIRYVPEDPGNAKVLGQREEEKFDGLMIPAGLMMTLIGLGCFVLGVKGYDLVQRDGKLRLVKLSELVGGSIPQVTTGSVPAVLAAPRLEGNSLLRGSRPSVGGKVPVGLMWLGWISLIYALIGLLMAIGKLMLHSSVGAEVELTDGMVISAEEGTGILVESAISMVLSVALAVAAIGLIRARRWSRGLARFASWGKILVAVGMAVYLVTATNLVGDENVSPEALEERRMVLIATFAGVLGAMLRLVFPMMVLSLLRMPQVRATLQEK